jgi:hypothetical protein
LLGEEYASLSPSSLEALGFLPPSNDPEVQMSEAQKRVVGQYFISIIAFFLLTSFIFPRFLLQSQR